MSTAPIQSPDKQSVPLVSVVIPAYNGADFLAETINSVLEQTYPNIEIIVIDDGSTDHTPQIMASYIGRINYQRKPNGGLATARNMGIQQARGEFVALLDGDDICLPERIAIQVACFAQLPDTVLCSSDFTAFSGRHVIETSHIATYYRILASTTGGIQAIYPSQQILKTKNIPVHAPGSNNHIKVLSGHVYETIIGGNFIHPPTVMVRRSIANAVGKFDESIRNGTDYDWLIRVCKLGPIAYLDVPLLMYRYSESQLSSPKNTAALALDAITTIKKLRHTDPALYKSRWLQFQRRIGTSYQHAADASLEQDKRVAAIQLLASVWHGVFNIVTIKIICKLLLPRPFIEWRRRHKKLETHPG